MRLRIIAAVLLCLCAFSFMTAVYEHGWVARGISGAFLFGALSFFVCVELSAAAGSAGNTEEQT